MKKLNIFFVPLVFCLSGCSVIMAVNEEKAPDISGITYGTHRAEVESILGTPVTSTREGAPSDIFTYQYFTGDKPNYGRAVAYGVLDVATLFLAELVTTPVEGLQGNKHVVEIRYDLDKRVKAISTYVEQAPIEKPEQMLGLEKL